MFSQIYEEYVQKVYRFLLSLTGDENQAEELTQQTFYKAFLHIESFEGKSSLYTWLCVIGKNEWFSECRRKKEMSLQEAHLAENMDRIMANTDIAAGEPENAEDAYIRKERRIAVQKALSELPQPYQDVLIMRFYGELPFKEIAAVHGKSESWAKMTYLRGKEKMKKRLEGNV